MTLDFLAQIVESDNIEDVWALHTEKMASYGFGRLLYGYTRFKTDKSLGDPLDTLMLTNCSQDYIDGFVTTGLYFNGPMMPWALENSGACSWSWVREQLAQDGFTAKEKEAIAFNQKMGITAGYTISFPSKSDRNKGATALAADVGMTQDDVDAVWQEHGRDILLINNVVHLKITSLPYSSARRSLTPRQREALEWVGEGKIMQDIATIMNLTPATIEKHLRLAREALDVETTAQAVLKASFKNQIFVVEG